MLHGGTGPGLRALAEEGSSTVLGGGTGGNFGSPFTKPPLVLLKGLWISWNPGHRSL